MYCYFKAFLLASPLYLTSLSNHTLFSALCVIQIVPENGTCAFHTTLPPQPSVNCCWREFPPKEAKGKAQRCAVGIH